MANTTRQAVVFASAILLGTAVPAAAQQALQQGVPVPGSGAPGPREINVDVGASATYDSNVAQASDARAALVGIEPEDIVFGPTASVDINLPFGRNVLTVGGDAAYRLYARNSERNGERIGLHSGLSSDFRACRTDLGAGISRARTEIGDFDPQSALDGLIDNFETGIDLSATVSCGATVGLRPFATVAYSSGSNSESLRKVQDYNTFGYGGGLIYSHPSIGEIGIVGSIEQTDFPKRPDGSLLLGQPSYKANSVGIYFNRAVARTLQATLQVNYTEVDPGIEATAFSGLSGNVSIRYVPGGQVSIEVLGARAVTPSLSYNVDYELETAGGVRVAVAFSPKLTGRSEFTYAHHKYYGSIPIGGVLLTDDDVGRLQTDVRWQFTPRLFFGVGAGYQWRSANDAYFDYDSARVWASVGLRL